jgi:hypothetical protein
MSETNLTRRAFGHQFALGVAGASLIADETVAQEAPEKKKAAAPEPEARQQPPEEAYLLGLVLRRYPDERLDEAAINAIVKDIRGDVIRGRVLSKFPLTNTDEPSPLFQPWRAAD